MFKIAFVYFLNKKLSWELLALIFLERSTISVF